MITTVNTYTHRGPWVFFLPFHTLYLSLYFSLYPSISVGFFTDFATDVGCFDTYVCEFLSIDRKHYVFFLSRSFVHSSLRRTTEYSLSWVFHSFWIQYRSTASTGKVSWSCNDLKENNIILLVCCDRFKRSLEIDTKLNSVLSESNIFILLTNTSVACIISIWFCSTFTIWFVFRLHLWFARILVKFYWSVWFICNQ